MDDSRVSGQRDSSVLSADHLAAWVDHLATVDANAPDAALIDQIHQLERLKAACAAAQASLTVAFVTSQTQGLPAAKARDDHAHRSIAAQIALARKESPARGNRLVGLAKALTREMPHTYAALQAGELSEWRATLLTRETACLSVEHRGQVDAELAGTFGGLGDKAVAQAAARIAQRLDPASVVARNRKAISERRVSIRPAPDTMAYVTALLPVIQGVAVYAALCRHADSAKAAGDPRGRGQLMADELVTRTTTPATATGAAGAALAGGTAAHTDVPATDRPGEQSPEATTGTTTAGTGAGGTRNMGPTTGSSGSGQADDTNLQRSRTTDETIDIATTSDPLETADDSAATVDQAAASDSDPADETLDPSAVPDIPAGLGLDIQLVMTDRTLFDSDNEPAHLIGYGPIPAALARRLVRDASPQTKAWIRRLYTDPDTGHLITGDTRRRDFNHGQRQFLVARDHTCRTAYCDAPIRHSDHVAGHANNGRTDVEEGQGLCAACNYLKEAPGWTSRVEPNGHTITTTTPTGHTHQSNPPTPPTSPPWQQISPRPDVSFVEARLRRILEAA